MFLQKVIASEVYNIRKEGTIYFPGKFTTAEGSISGVNTGFSKTFPRQFIFFKFAERQKKLSYSSKQ